MNTSKSLVLAVAGCVAVWGWGSAASAKTAGQALDELNAAPTAKTVEVPTTGSVDTSPAESNEDAARDRAIENLDRSESLRIQRDIRDMLDR